MHSYQAYQRQQELGWTRIDLLLALFDGAIQRLEQTLAALQAGDQDSARALLTRCRMIVGGLVAGVTPAYEGAEDFCRLYEFVLFNLRAGGADKLEGALRVLQTMREGFREARPEALRLEREGVIPPPDGTVALSTLA